MYGFGRHCWPSKKVQKTLYFGLKTLKNDGLKVSQ
jgi:hypothetical protein